MDKTGSGLLESQIGKLGTVDSWRVMVLKLMVTKYVGKRGLSKKLYKLLWVFPPKLAKFGVLADFSQIRQLKHKIQLPLDVLLVFAERSKITLSLFLGDTIDKQCR